MLTVVDQRTGRTVDRRGRHNLYLHGKGRLYVFELSGPHWVVVRRYEGDRCTEARTQTNEQARRLWAWLTKLGYARV